MKRAYGVAIAYCCPSIDIIIQVYVHKYILFCRKIMNYYWERYGAYNDDNNGVDTRTLVK